MTRRDRFLEKYYDCSSHFVWIGERTRQLDGGHVEFFRGISNPIGIKVSEKIHAKELIKLLDKLNPENRPGRICLITRMGVDNIREHLPPLIDTISNHGRNVVWVCDPMHGNGKVLDGKKTRYFKDILLEVEVFFDIHNNRGTIPGGIHLEMTANDVTECIGGKYVIESNTFLEKKYLSSCDTRLNCFQVIELIENIANWIK